MVVPDERTGEEVLVIQSGHEMCGQDPQSPLDPDPILPAIGDVPPAYPLRQGPRLQPQTEDTAPDELAAPTRHVFEGGTTPLLRRGIRGSVGRHGEEVDVIWAIHTAEGADRLGDGALLG